MSTPADASPQYGLLDLSVDLSVPEVYSGTEFTLYLHVKNPFPSRVWIRSVELSLPTQLSWRPATDGSQADAKAREVAALTQRVGEREAEIAKLRERLDDLEDPETDRHGKLSDLIAKLTAENNRDLSRIARTDGVLTISAHKGSRIYLTDTTSRSIHLSANQGSDVHLSNVKVLGDDRVPLTGSLPHGAALEPGCTDVWTIRLGSNRSPFFTPARYRLQLTVIYCLGAPDQEPEALRAASDERIYSNTVAVTVPIKTALWSVILGGVLGGTAGSIGRSLQEAKTIDALLADNLGACIGSLLLAIILSGAGIIFAARKSEAQSFVTVEDFWGGLLVGFLIGYSGTAAFAKISGIQS
ncbi:hypothetical protein ACQPZZ_38790 [Microbispora sp. CA-135349]|uniref:hypothetical protein n=1 Tax=Microbispora sp. CA-135349 TaxID=3239953 RepID=UPI003D94F19C